MTILFSSSSLLSSSLLPPSLTYSIRCSFSTLVVLQLLLLLILQTFAVVPAIGDDEATSPLAVSPAHRHRRHRIAIIGGGIGGSFAAKYLSDYDSKCQLDVIDVYEPSPMVPSMNDVSFGESITSNDKDDDDDNEDSWWQGSRVTSVMLPDKTIVELGASIIYDGNQLVVEMIQNDPQLKMGRPFFPGTEKAEREEKEQQEQEQLQQLQQQQQSMTAKKGGFGIYNDIDGNWLLNTAGTPTQSTTTTTITTLQSWWNYIWDWFTNYSWFRNLIIVWRYNIDLFRMSKAATNAITRFDQIYKVLNNTNIVLASPDEIWKQVGLLPYTLQSYDEFLNDIGICQNYETMMMTQAQKKNNNNNKKRKKTSSISSPWWRYYLPFQGCIRTELLSAVTINNYNQEITRMNGLSGLVSFVPSQGKLFSIENGNYQIIPSAIKQAQTQRNRVCASVSKSYKTLRHVQKKVTKIISYPEMGTIQILSSQNEGTEEEKTNNNNNNDNHYDIVVLAVPLQHCNISFHVHNAAVKDNAVDDAETLVVQEQKEDDNKEKLLQPMPFNWGTTAKSSSRDVMPSSASRQYIPMITTVVSHATLQKKYFNLKLDGSDTPRSIMFVSFHPTNNPEGITTIIHLTADGTTFKTFSQKPLSNETLQKLFGSNVRVEYCKRWGGTLGGAVPDFNGGGPSSQSAPFLLYHGSGRNRHDDDDKDENSSNNNNDSKNIPGTTGFGPALYYVNSMEASVAAVEISAIGAKAVAKLIAHHIQLIETNNTVTRTNNKEAKDHNDGISDHGEF